MWRSDGCWSHEASARTPVSPVHSKVWSAAYLHRAVQLARDEADTPDQLEQSVQALRWLCASDPDGIDARDGAARAPLDCATTRDGARDWVLLTAPNYRKAGSVFRALGSLQERVRLIDSFVRLLESSQRQTAAHALVSRMRDEWHIARATSTEFATAPSEATGSEAVVSASDAPLTHALAVPVEDAPPEAPAPVITTPSVDSPVEVPAPPTPLTRETDVPPTVVSSDVSLPVPDPAWFALIAAHVPAKVTKGAKEVEGSLEFSRRETWDAIAEWMQRLTYAALGDGWTADPHRNWQNSGYLTGYYWAKVHPAHSAFGNLFNIGVQLSHRIQWVDEFAPELEHYREVPSLAVWVTTNDNAVAALRTASPEQMDTFAAIYQRHSDAAFSRWPELWSDGGALVRWYRTNARGKFISRLVPFRQFRADVSSGVIDPARATPGLWSPLMPLAEAIENPAAASDLIARFLRPFGSILHDTYEEMAARSRTTPSRDSGVRDANSWRELVTRTRDMNA